MSGGHFDYQQYMLREIADTIERDIARAMAPKPPKRHEDYWTIYEMTRPFSYHSLHNAFQEFDSYDKALKYLNAMEDVIKAAKEYECWRLLEEEVPCPAYDSLDRAGGSEPGPGCPGRDS